MRFTRRRTIEMARVRHALAAISNLYYTASSSTWVGDEASGAYIHDNGAGDFYRLRWTPTALVGLVFAHESERSEFDSPVRRPLRHLVGLPPQLTDLVLELAAQMEDLVTAGLWCEHGGEVVLSDELRVDRFVHGLELLAGYAFPPEETVLGAALPQSWLELSSLTEAQATLAMHIATAGEGEPAASPKQNHRPMRLTDEDPEILLTRPPDTRPVTLEAAERTRTMLAQLDVVWVVPTARLRAGLDAEARAREHRVAVLVGARERALFEAARSNDTSAIGALLAGGADVDVRTIEDQWDHTPAGDTPLIQAIKAGALDAAFALVDGGAAMAPQNSFGQTALFWASRVGSARLVSACLARGADPSVTTHAGETPLHAAARTEDPAVAEVLLAAGARTDARAADGRTPADFARASGNEDLARWLTPGRGGSPS